MLEMSSISNVHARLQAISLRRYTWTLVGSMRWDDGGEQVSKYCREGSGVTCEVLMSLLKVSNIIRKVEIKIGFFALAQRPREYQLLNGLVVFLEFCQKGVYLSSVHRISVLKSSLACVHRHCNYRVSCE